MRQILTYLSVHSSDKATTDYLNTVYNVLSNVHRLTLLLRHYAYWFGTWLVDPVDKKTKITYPQNPTSILTWSVSKRGWLEYLKAKTAAGVKFQSS